MYIALAVLIAMHGLAHMVGFAAPFGYLQNPPPMDTLLFGRVALPEPVMKFLGILWLAAVIVFVVAAYGVFRRASWWMPVTLAACVLSIALTFVFLPYAKIGLAVNLALIAFLVANRQGEWIAAS